MNDYGFKVVAVEVSLINYRLRRPVGGSGVAAVDVVLARIRLADGPVGLGFSYVLGGSGAGAALLARELAEAQLVNRRLDHPEAAWRRMALRLNRTRRGPNYIGLAALDLALWDAYARALDVPLGIALGGAPREVPVYGSGEFHAQQSAAQAADTARRQVERGLRAVKPRVAARASDEALIAAVRAAIGTGVELMLDANEKGSATTAERLLAVARDHGALFVEEPLAADDVAGYRALARAHAGRIAAGEHLQGCTEALPFISERLCAMVQPDLAMMGGMTECLRVARLAEAFGVEVAPHFLPGLFIHLAAASPALTWLEEFPLLEPLFEGWPQPGANGLLALPPGPGHGLTLSPSPR